MLYSWTHEYSGTITTHETGVSASIVSSYFIMFRNACLEYACNLPKHNIGGYGKTVKIDETLMCKRKYNRGRMIKEVWIFGGIYLEDKDVFAVVVSDRSSDTLEQEIKDHIAPDTHIIYNYWASYNGI